VLGIPYSFLYPREIFEINNLGPLNLLNADRDLKTKIFFLVSSTETYGDYKYLPIDDRHPQFPKSPYAGFKAAMKKLSWGFIYAYDMPVTIIR